jgi:cellulose synthase/poly-beta-1,6-N-acetylglucosamine synthase-like glycosyltransferase
MAIVFIIGCAALIILGIAQELLRFRRFPRIGPAAALPDAPPVSLIIPARNEERSIGTCLSGALDQQYPAYEIIMVDDASIDATARIAAEFAACDPRLRLMSSADLPPGWVGKCHACAQAAEQAHGEWLLFLDADTHPQPALIAGMLAYARRQQLDVLSLFPRLELDSFWERLILPAFYTLVRSVYPAERVSAHDAAPAEVLANGQALLVRRAAYEAIGGHAAVRNEVLEDVYLAQVLRKAGFRIGIALAPELLSVRMYTSGTEVLAGLGKNAAAGYHNGGWRARRAMLRLLGLSLLPLWLPGIALAAWNVQGDPGSMAALLMSLLAFAGAYSYWTWLLRHLHGLPWYFGLLWPLAVLGYAFIALRSIWQVRRGRGVIWKGRTYVGR